MSVGTGAWEWEILLMSVDLYLVTELGNQVKQGYLRCRNVFLVSVGVQVTYPCIRGLQ